LCSPKPKHNTTRQALQWNPQGKRGRGRPRNSRRRDLIAEMEIEGYRWQDLERMAHEIFLAFQIYPIILNAVLWCTEILIPDTSFVSSSKMENNNIVSSEHLIKKTNRKIVETKEILRTHKSFKSFFDG
jgi:hypothetical protein